MESSQSSTDRSPSARHPHYLAVALLAPGSFLSAVRNGDRLRWQHPPGPTTGRGRRPSGGGRPAAPRGSSHSKAADRLRHPSGMLRETVMGDSGHTARIKTLVYFQWRLTDWEDGVSAFIIGSRFQLLAQFGWVFLIRARYATLRLYTYPIQLSTSQDWCGCVQREFRSSVNHSASLVV